MSENIHNMRPDRRFCVAPMMDWTDRHDRYMLRLISRHAMLYSEMVTADAVIYGDRDYLIGYNDAEHPVALQLGGAEPDKMAKAAEIAQAFGYDEVNINVGCPSDRVQSGRFGACLMAEPHTVAACVAAMRQAVDIPVTVKSRIGINEHDNYDYLKNFVEIVAASGCQVFIIHARVAILDGLSPKENREIPPLKYQYAHFLKADFPELEVILNGGLQNLEEAKAHLDQGLDGVMFGREAYHNPYRLAEVDRIFYGDEHPIPSRHDIVEQMLPYIEAHCALQNRRLSAVTRHMLALFQGQPGARAWRRFLSENAYREEADADLVRQALSLLPPPADISSTRAS